MLDLTQKALERLKSGSSKKADPEDAPNPFRDAVQEAFEAVEARDFDRFHSALESAVDIRLADKSMDSDTPSDVEPWELDELKQ